MPGLENVDTLALINYEMRVLNGEWMEATPIRDRASNGRGPSD